MLIFGVVVFARFRVDAGGQAEGSAAGHPFACAVGGMVTYDRDRMGSIKKATTPREGGGQTQNDPRPVTSEPAHAAFGVCSRARMRPSRRP
jgi:hypothetical protein